MISLLKTILLMTKRRQVRNGMQGGFRVRLWRWTADSCLCEDEEIFITIKGVRDELSVLR